MSSLKLEPYETTTTSKAQETSDSSKIAKSAVAAAAVTAAGATMNGATSRTKINDTKAGMENIDKEKINAIILKHSKSI